MKKIVLTYGLITGIILTANTILYVSLLYNIADLKSYDVVWFMAIIGIFSLVFFGIRNMRNKYLERYISFLKAFKTGLLIVLVGSTAYVILMLLYYYLIVPDFLDVYTTHVLNNTPESDLPDKTVVMENLKQMYKNPILVVLLNFLEVFPFGLVIAFVSAWMLKSRVESIPTSKIQ